MTNHTVQGRLKFSPDMLHLGVIVNVIDGQSAGVVSLQLL